MQETQRKTWYEDESFWRTFTPTMFNKERLDVTAVEIDQIIVMLEKMYKSLDVDEDGELLLNHEWASAYDYNETIKEVLQEITSQFIRPKKGVSGETLKEILEDMHCGGCDGYELNCDFGALLQKNLKRIEELSDEKLDSI